MNGQSILWRRLDRPGHEFCRLIERDGDWHLSGTAVFTDERGPCRLDYAVVCDAAWRTRSGQVRGWVGDRDVRIEVTVHDPRGWLIDGAECRPVAGGVDLDLNFSPSTNLLPIRRLDLSVGEEAEVRAAWLRFPSFALEPLVQRYRRLAEHRYRYESGGGSFVAELRVNRAGFVTHYPDLWQIEPAS